MTELDDDALGGQTNTRRFMASGLSFSGAYQGKNTAILGIFPSLTDGRWTLALTRLAYILALIIPALASEAITVDTQWDCPYVPETKLNPCPARTSTYMPVLRALQAGRQGLRRPPRLQPRPRVGRGLRDRRDEARQNASGGRKRVESRASLGSATAAAWSDADHPVTPQRRRL